MDLITELGRIVHEKDFEGYARVKESVNSSFQLHEGLSHNQVEHNRQAFGPNLLPKSKEKLFVQFVWEASQDKVLILLTGAAILSLIVHYKNGGWIEGAAIIIAVIVVILVNAINDWKKDRLFRSLNQKSQSGLKSKVLRSGMSDLVPNHDLVIYDLVQLEPGNIVPADCILVEETHPLVVDESTATGESKTLTKHLEMDPFFLSGTKITDGSGKALVVAIGESSFHGKLIMAMRGEVELTPLQVQLNDLADFIAKGGLALAVFLFVSLVFKHFRDEDILSQLSEFSIAAITVVVVAVPEGLPMAVTLALAFATNRMLKDNNLVRVLASCETMGRVTTICSDKTGTLTENRMTVVKCSLLKDELSEEALAIINEGLALNSTAFEVESNEAAGQFDFVGSATEAALLRFMKTMGASYSLLRRQVQLKKVIPFSSARKLMISVTSDNRIHLKGAAEIILERCNMIMREDGSVMPMTDVGIREIKRFLNEMNTDALRSIGQAYSEEPVILDGDEFLLEMRNFTWLAAYGIEDPLRPGVKEAVSTCQNAGIFVRMVTGDCRETAESIARRCGILMRGGLVMEGSEFRGLSDPDLVLKLPKLQVLARSSPLDKQRLVKLLKKSLSEIVAVTGDGSNDGPALKASDVGFSMGITGTQLAQEASSIVLLDDNFASIVKAASWGRCITRSVRKFLQFQLTVNVSAVSTALVTALTTKTSVLTAIQMLWVNLLMDSMGALALATDLPTPDLLNVPPERPGSPLINSLMAWQIGTQAALQLALCLGIFYGNPFRIGNESVLRTFIFNLFVFLQLFNELNCRSISGKWRVDLIHMFELTNWMFWVIWIGTAGLQIGIVEWGGAVFGTVGLSITLWAWSLGLSAVSVVLAVFVKVLCGNLDVSYAQLHPTREQLAWQSAIHHVRARARFYSAIRRRQGEKELTNSNNTLKVISTSSSSSSSNSSIESLLLK